MIEIAPAAFVRAPFSCPRVKVRLRKEARVFSRVFTQNSGGRAPRLSVRLSRPVAWGALRRQCAAMGLIACFGELLLRMTAPGRELLLQTGRLDVHVGGAEANVAIGLARLGHDTMM